MTQVRARRTIVPQSNGRHRAINLYTRCRILSLRKRIKNRLSAYSIRSTPWTMPYLRRLWPCLNHERWKSMSQVALLIENTTMDLAWCSLLAMTHVADYSKESSQERRLMQIDQSCSMERPPWRVSRVVKVRVTRSRAIEYKFHRRWARKKAMCQHC